MEKGDKVMTRINIEYKKYKKSKLATVISFIGVLIGVGIGGILFGVVINRIFDFIANFIGRK